MTIYRFILATVVTIMILTLLGALTINVTGMELFRGHEFLAPLLVGVCILFVILIACMIYVWAQVTYKDWKNGTRLQSDPYYR
jgi:NADH:ubiquinone oxidoreductase subunit 6 (subunit J)